MTRTAQEGASVTLPATPEKRAPKGSGRLRPALLPLPEGDLAMWPSIIAVVGTLQQAALAAFGLREASDHTDLAARREVAIAATDELVAAAGRAMA